MREQKVAVAIVQDSQGRFLVTYNEKWGGYAFPLVDFDPDAEVMAAAAVQALEHDLHCRLPHAKSTELEYLGRFGRSGRTGEETWYDYWLFEVDPGQPLELAKASQSASHPPLFLDANALLSRTDLTWSTPALAKEFLDNQEAVLAIVTRPGASETEYLVLRNENYHGYFFPTTRVTSEHKPAQVAARLLHADLGYRGPVKAEWRGEAVDVHFSGRVLRNRSFRFHVCQVELPQIDLQRPYNPLELALTGRGKRWRWVTAGQLSDAAIHYSPTMTAVRATVVGLIPPQPRREPPRRSEGGLALIQRTVDGRSQWLAQWNQGWGALFFVGGHREASETFRECVIREIREELSLQTSEFSVAPEPAHRLDYLAFSERAGCETGYRQELFATTIKPAALAKIEQQHDNVWLTEEEIRALEAQDARPISVTMLSLLLMSGELRGAKPTTAK